VVFRIYKPNLDGRFFVGWEKQIHWKRVLRLSEHAREEITGMSEAKVTGEKEHRVVYQDSIVEARTQ
jgi:hypothetical protein